MKRTKGTPADPIIIKHEVWEKDTMGTDPATWNIYDISQYKACKIDKVLDDYCASSVTAENQVFYLEGGKTYFVSSNVQVYKGFTLTTNPADLAAGKGRAKFYLSGMTKTGTSVNTCNFMLGRQPVAGENASITLDTTLSASWNSTSTCRWLPTTDTLRRVSAMPSVTTS